MVSRYLHWYNPKTTTCAACQISSINIHTHLNGLINQRSILTQHNRSQLRKHIQAARQEEQSILAPNILRISLRQPAITPKLLLPANETALQNINLLVVALLLTERTRALARIAQRGGRTPLLAERAVENDLLLVLERADQFGHAIVERRAGDPGRAADVAAHMVCKSRVREIN